MIARLRQQDAPGDRAAWMMDMARDRRGSISVRRFLLSRGREPDEFDRALAWPELRIPTAAAQTRI